MEGLLRVARAGMEDMYRRVADLGYMLLLTDADGITVDYIGNPASEKQLKAAGLYLGADWNEAHAGTCGVGTCLIEQTTITCHQAEHFDATHIALTCTSSPLFAPDGQLLGVLDCSALHSPEARESQHLALQLTSIYAQRIEDANFLRHFTRQHILRLGTARGLVEVAGDLMFALDDDGVIVGANTGARRRFGQGGLPGASRLVGSTLEDALGIDMGTLAALARGGPGAAATTVQVGHGEPYFPVVIAPRHGSGSTGTTPSDTQPAAARTPRQPPAAVRPAALPLDRLLGDDAAMQRLVDQGRRLRRPAREPADLRRDRHAARSWSRARCIAQPRAPARPVRGGQLRGAARDADRERAVRPREGRLHRRRRAQARAGSSWPTAARCSSTRSATCRWRCRPSCCACSRSASSRRVGAQRSRIAGRRRA